jgi:hypothetical protein
VILTTQEDVEVRALTEEQGLDYEIFCPAWVRDFWDAKLGNKKTGSWKD